MILREERVLRTTSTRSPANAVLPSRSSSQMIVIPRAALRQLGGNLYPSLVRAKLRHRVAVR
eukprot:9036617-Pyramimonas_sp.AAC.1